MSTRRISQALVGSVLSVTLAGCGGSDAPPAAVIDPGPAASYHPSLDPARFVAQVTNPYLPLKPGARWVYDGSEHVEVVVTDQTKVVAGITAVVVRDTVSEDGEVTEDTYDWFAQDVDGAVWYLGEATQEMEHGKVTSTEGSWEAGVEGALAGIAMPAHPMVGAAYRQEYLKDEAEDMAEVLSVDGSATALGRAHSGAVVIREWTPLEPKVIEEKTYVAGIGNTAQKSVKGEHSELTLTSFVPGH